MSYVRQGPLTFSRASTATYVGRDGLLKTAAINEPRIEFDPVTGLSKGLLIEGAGTNLLTYSEEINLWSYANSQIFTINGEIAPDGKNTAEDVVRKVSGNDYIWKTYNTTANAGKTYTFSVWLNKGTRNESSCALVIRDGSGGNIVWKNVAWTEKWARYSATGTFSSNAAANISVFIDPNDGTGTSPINAYYCVWGAQLEEGSEATSYIRTTGSIGTRAADVATFSTQDNLLPINATAQEKATSYATARLSDIPVPLRSLWNPDTCPVSLLPWLAWGLSVDEWNPDWTEPQKRSVIRESVSVHRLKGTIGAVRRIVDSFGLGIVIREWWQKSPAGTPHTFTLSISVDQIPTGARDSIINSVRKAKPIRSDFDLDYQTGYLAQVNNIILGQNTIYDRFQASLN
ncbi:MAG: phage tail protein I [Chthoniobacterales bacterium]